MIGDLKFKKGTFVTTHYFCQNFDSDFHEDPHEFKVERWLDENSLTNRTIKENPYAFLPFSGGPRRCVGQLFAMIEAKLMFAELLRSFEISFANPPYDLVIA